VDRRGADHRRGKAAELHGKRRDHRAAGFGDGHGRLVSREVRARRKVPYFGSCLGMQIAGSSSTRRLGRQGELLEFDAATEYR
jgi:CTP synthase (UTP-ammonia lyase)